MSSPTSSASTAPQPVVSTRPMQAVLILSVLFFLARFTGLLQRQIISALLPADATDAYSAAFRLPDILNQLVAGGAISLTFIPIFTRFWSKGREAEAWRFFSTLMTIMGAALVVLTALMMLFTPQLLALLLPGWTTPALSAKLDLAVTMTRIILPAQLFFYLGGLLVGVLNAFKRFSATGWTSAIYNIAAILIGLLLWTWLGAIAFAWGILVGAFIGNFLLPFLSIMRGPIAQRPRFSPRFAVSDPAVKRFFLLALPIMFGVSLPVVDQIIVSYFSSGMAKGSLTHLDNGNRLMIAAQGVIGQAAAVAAFPYLAAEVANGDYRAFSGFLRSGLRRLLFVTLPLSVLLILWAAPITRLLFGYGEYNTPEKLHETALCFALFNVGLFAWGGQGLVARGFYAMGDTRTPTIVGSLLAVVLFVPLCAYMTRWGAAGLALATSIGATAHFVSILILLSRKLEGQKYKSVLGLDKIGSTVLRTGAACGLMGLAGILAQKLALPVISNDKLGDLVLIVWTGALSSLVFAFAANRFKIHEWLWLKGKVMRRRRA